MANEKSQVKSRALQVLLDHIAVAEHKAGLPTLAPIKRTIDFSPTLETARYMYHLVKNERERDAFFKDPKGSLVAAGLQRDAAKADLVVELVKDVASRVKGRKPSDVFDSYTSKESDTHQQWNFDSSGRSSETTKGSIVGEKTKFDGFGLVEEIFENPELGKTFFPSQPLVTPELVTKIRQRLPAELGGIKAIGPKKQVE